VNRRSFIMQAGAAAAAIIAAPSLALPSRADAAVLSLAQLKTGAFSGVLLGSTVPPAMSLAQREAQLGHVYNVQHAYSNGGFSSVPTAEPGHLLAVTLSSGSKTDWVTMANAGQLDAAYAAACDKITSPTFVMIWQEFNGHWMMTFPSNYKGGAGAFVKAWRRLALILRRNPNIILCWAPNVYCQLSSSLIDPEQMYPGDDVVDWVAFDGYCHGSYHSFDQIFGQAIADYGPHGRRHKHPFMVGETAAQSSLAPDKYVTSIHQSLTSGAAKGLVKGLLWFDNPWLPDGYNVDATASELSAYKKLVTDTALTVG
jgi:hypothetical protein